VAVSYIIDRLSEMILREGGRCFRGKMEIVRQKELCDMDRNDTGGRQLKKQLSEE